MHKCHTPARNKERCLLFFLSNFLRAVQTPTDDLRSRSYRHGIEIQKRCSCWDAIASILPLQTVTSKALWSESDESCTNSILLRWSHLLTGVSVRHIPEKVLEGQFLPQGGTKDHIQAIYIISKPPFVPFPTKTTMNMTETFCNASPRQVVESEGLAWITGLFFLFFTYLARKVRLFN